jgi:hypothetical protein
MRATSWVVLTGLAVVACEAPDRRVESRAQPIVAGPADPGDPAIMELLSNKGALWSRCTATLVTPRVLLTAAHCLVETPGFPLRAVFPGKDDSNFTDKDLLPLQATAFDPAYRTARQGHDFAVAVLATPLPIRPVPINRASLDKAQGKTVRYVGYGLVNGLDSSTGGVKRTATAPIAQVDGTLITLAPAGHGSCQGDSGGPMMLDVGQGESGESIIGIASFIDNSTCIRDSFFQRLDSQIAWVDEQIAKYDPGGSAPGDDAAAAPADAGPPDGGASAPPPLSADAQAPSPDLAPPPASQPADAAPTVGAEPAPASPPVRAAPRSSGGCSYGKEGPRLTWTAASLAIWLARRRRRSVAHVDDQRRAVGAE